MKQILQKVIVIILIVALVAGQAGTLNVSANEKVRGGVKLKR